MQYDSSWLRVADLLRPEVARLPAGARIPSSRELVARYQASATTVARAVDQLARDGLVEVRPGAGAFRATAAPRRPVGDTSWQLVTLTTAVNGDGPAPRDRSADADGLLATLIPPTAGVIDLCGGYPHPSLQPEAALTAALARAGRRTGSWSKPPTEGIPELRDWFAQEIGGGLTRHGILIGSAGQASLATVLRALTRPGESIVVESPTYPGVIAVAHATGLRLVPVPVDDDGLRTDLVDAALRRGPARVVVVQPAFQNPTGATLTPERRAELVAVARRHGAFVVEDDFARYLAHTDAGPEPDPLVAADDDGVVVHVRSLTKATSPNLRIGAIAARGPVLDRLRAALVVDNFFVARPLQEAALELVSAAAWPRHVRQLGRALGSRQVAALRGIATAFGDGAVTRRPRGGFHLWLTLPDDCRDTDVASAALRRGVAVIAGRAYYPRDAPANRVRVTFSSPPTEAAIEEGIALLGRAAEESRPVGHLARPRR